MCIRDRYTSLRDASGNTPLRRESVVYSHSEATVSQKAADQVDVAIWKTDFREFVKDTLVPHAVKGFLYV